jgi:hypothetical protein
MIDHRRALMLAATAIDFPLDASERGVLDAHVRECAACRMEVAAYHHDAARLAALPPTAPPAWVRGAIGRSRRPNRIVLLAAAALLLTASAGVALVGAELRNARTPDVLPSERPVPSAAAVNQPPDRSSQPTRTPMSSPPIWTTGSIPAALGDGQMAPGPDGGLYVLIDAPQVLLAGPPSRTVLALLDAGGQPRPGWPIALAGWNCSDPNGAERAWSAAADGSTRLVCSNDIVGDAAPRHVAFAFDATGRVMPGWPVELPAGDMTSPPQVVGTELRVLQHEFATTNGDGSPQAGAWWVTGVAADGTIRQGVRYDVPDIVPYQDVRLGSDGAAYLLAVSGTPGAEITQIVALDVSGVRDGWPLKVQGVVSHPSIGPQGRVYVVQTQGTGASIRSQTLVFEPNGLDVPIGSAALPVPARSEWTGAGADFFLAAPTVAADGTAFIVADVGGRTVAYAIDPSGVSLPGWPAPLEAGLQMQGTCDASGTATGCGVWSTSPSVGPDDTVYLLLAGTDPKHAGSIVAITPDGQVRPGWPVRVPTGGAGFWSAVVSPDGTVYAMAVEPSPGGTVRTLYAIAADGTVRGRTPIVDPAASTEPASSPGPTEFAPPSPACPAPSQAAKAPRVTASIGGGPGIVATYGGSTMTTCSTVGSDDVVPIKPTKGLVAHPGDLMTLTLPSGWQFLHWEGSDHPVVGAGSNTWPPIDLPGRPAHIDVPVPRRSGDSIAGYSFWIVSVDGRIVGRLDVLVRVSVR